MTVSFHPIGLKLQPKYWLILQFVESLKFDHILSGIAALSLTPKDDGRSDRSRFLSDRRRLLTYPESALVQKLGLTF
jgi:hypothetical protein